MPDQIDQMNQTQTQAPVNNQQLPPGQNGQTQSQQTNPASPANPEDAYDYSIDPATGTIVQTPKSNGADGQEAELAAAAQVFSNLTQRAEQTQSAQYAAPTPEQIAQQTQALATTLQKNIADFALPETLFKDVDMSDPTAVRGILETSLRTGITTAVRLATQVMHAQFKAVDGEIDRRIKSATDKSRTVDTEAQQLQKAIPAFNNPSLAPMLQELNRSMAAAGTSLADRIKALRPIAANLAPAASKGQPSTQTPTPGSLLQGDAALDFLIPRG